MNSYALAAELIALLASRAGEARSVAELARALGEPSEAVERACELLRNMRLLVFEDDAVAMRVAREGLDRPLVLVAENAPAVANVVQALLESEGYDVLIATSLPVGLAVLGATPVDLVIADSFATTARGAVERLAELRDAATPAPVWIFTAHRDISEREVREANYAGLLPKPFDIDELLQRVAESLPARG